jgi:hypothetical protein
LVCVELRQTQPEQESTLSCSIIPGTGVIKRVSVIVDRLLMPTDNAQYSAAVRVKVSNGA